MYSVTNLAQAISPRACMGLVWKIFHIPLLALTHGDIRANIMDLVSGPARADVNLANLRGIVARRGLSYGIRCLELLKSTSCSTRLVEQAHSPGSKMQRHHRLVGADNIIARSIVYHAGIIFPWRSQSQSRILGTAVTYVGEHTCCVLIVESLGQVAFTARCCWRWRGVWPTSNSGSIAGRQRLLRSAASGGARTGATRGGRHFATTSTGARRALPSRSISDRRTSRHGGSHTMWSRRAEEHI